MNAATTLAASVQAKKGRLYAVIQVRENGRTKPVWRALGLPESANKSKVNKAYREVVQAFEQSYAEQIAQNKKPASDIPIYDYMCAYYKKIEKNIQKSTVESYRGMINGRIRRYFTARKELTVGNITAKDIEDFYEWMFESGVVANTVIHYHTVLHSAFKRAFKDGLIDSNPFDRIDRPKKNKFTGENYSEEELIAMLGLIRGDIIYPAVMLAGGLGLRRSEALGARWSRVDWEKKTILLDTKIIEYKENGKVIVEPVEEMKNKSSRRTLPLPDPVYEMLCEEREKQDLYRRMFKGSYNRKYDDYICVDQLGGLIRPNRVTQRFADLIRQYGLRKIRFHDLRHTFATRALERGMDYKTLSAILGHYSVAFTMDTYVHSMDEHKRHEMDKMDDMFGMQYSISVENQPYPVLCTLSPDGCTAHVPDFPKIEVQTPTLDAALLEVKQQIQKALRQYKNPPIPTKQDQIVVPTNSVLVLVKAG